MTRLADSDVHLGDEEARLADGDVHLGDEEARLGDTDVHLGDAGGACRRQCGAPR
jgi:hypothetical protein